MIVNTIAQYARTILNVCLALYSTRLILAALGQSDYGVYSVVGGVVALLSFLTQAMATTTQRYLSYARGEGTKEYIRKVFGNSMLLHMAIGAAVVAVLGIMGKWVVYDVLNIEVNRQWAAAWVYYTMVLMLLLSFLNAPVRALFIARENIVYASIVDVLDGVLKLGIAVWLTHCEWDRLVMYGVGMLGIQVFNVLAFGIYAGLHYEEFHFPHWKEWNSGLVKELGSFAGWTMYSAGCVMVRTQGIAILLNRFLGTLYNAAYGIAGQVVGAVGFLSQAINNAMSPQIIKAEGEGDRARMLRLSMRANKYSYLLLSIVAIPLVAEMPGVLDAWLGSANVPRSGVMFCRCILLSALVDQLTNCLTIANMATGKIKYYALLVNTVKVLTLPVCWVVLAMGMDVVWVMVCYIGFELVCALVRLLYIHVTTGLRIGDYVRNVWCRIFFPTLITIGVVYVLVSCVVLPYRFLLTLVCAVVAGSLASFGLAFDKEERNILLRLMRLKR